MTSFSQVWPNSGTILVSMKGSSVICHLKPTIVVTGSFSVNYQILIYFKLTITTNYSVVGTSCRILRLFFNHRRKIFRSLQPTFPSWMSTTSAPAAARRRLAGVRTSSRCSGWPVVSRPTPGSSRDCIKVSISQVWTFYNN